MIGGAGPWSCSDVVLAECAARQAPRLANKGVGVRLLAALAGHSHISTTQRYIDVNADQMRDAVELL